MVYHQAATEEFAQALAPGVVDGTVFQNVILIAVGIVIYYICRAVIAQGLHAFDIGGLRQFNQRRPAHEVALVSSVWSGTIAVVEIFSVVHQAPVVHAGGLVVDVVEIGKTKHVGYFMHVNTDAVQLGIVLASLRGVIQAKEFGGDKCRSIIYPISGNGTCPTGRMHAFFVSNIGTASGKHYDYPVNLSVCIRIKFAQSVGNPDGKRVESLVAEYGPAT